MTKSLSIIVLSIILIAATQAKGKNLSAQVAALLAYTEPAEYAYSECDDDLVGVSHKALELAMALPDFPKDLKPSSDELASAKCQWAWPRQSKTWFKFTFSREDKVCTVYAVATYYSMNLRSGPKLTLTSDFTLRANKELGKCEPVQKEVVELDLGVEIQEPVEEQVNLVADEKDLVSEDFVSTLERQESEDLDLPISLNNETPKIELPELDFDEDELFNLPLPVLRRRNAHIWKPKNNVGEFQDHSESFESLFDQKTEEDALFAHPLGGWNVCNPEEHEYIDRVFRVLAGNGHIHNVEVFSQNVIHCEKQIVNGINYNMIVGLNAKKCQVAFHSSTQREISLLTSAYKFPEVLDCIELLSAL